MTKFSLEPHHNAHDDLFFWAKQYLASKMLSLDITKGWEISFNRLANHDRIIAVANVDELDELTREIRREGMKNLGIYSVAIIAFCRYALADKKIESIKEVDTAYRDRYFIKNPNNLKSGTLNSYLTQVNSLFKFIEEHGVDEEINRPYNFGLGLTRSGKRTTSPIEQDEREPDYLRPDEFKRFLDALETYKFRGENTAQMRLLMKIAAFGGLRTDEVVSLKTSDISIVSDPSAILPSGEYFKITLIGKGKKRRVVHIKATLIKKDYDNHMAHRTCQGDILFRNNKNNPYSTRSPYEQLRRLLLHAGLGKKGMHSLRRSYATWLMSQNVDYAVISELLGHESEEMTDLYVQLTRDGLRSIVKYWEDI